MPHTEEGIQHSDVADSFGYGAVIGDVIGSRRFPSRAHLQRRLGAALRQTNDELNPIQPMTITIGDEFQGLFQDLGEAIEASLRVRLELQDEVDVRFGIGWGPLTIYDSAESPMAQDGPVWWAARDALNRATFLLDARDAPRGLRTFFATYKPFEAASSSPHEVQQPRLPWMEAAVPEPTALPARIDDLVNAVLSGRDELIFHMDDRDARLLLGLLDNRTQADLGRMEGISQSAVSQRLVRNGAYAVKRMHELLGRMGW